MDTTRDIRWENVREQLHRTAEVHAVLGFDKEANYEELAKMLLFVSRRFWHTWCESQHNAACNAHSIS
jgi:hypothetical protein